MAKIESQLPAWPGTRYSILWDTFGDSEFNMNVTLYVFPEEKVEEIDVGKEWDELHAIEREIA